jgi:Domain of unknown function (DUF4249)
MRKSICIIILLGFIGLMGCIDEVKFTSENYKPKLIVDGSISNAPGPYKIMIFSSKEYTGDGQTVPLNVSQVAIVEENGKSFNLNAIDAGIYETDSIALRGQVGKSYYVKIRTLDGREYQSKPERILPPVPIDTYRIDFSSNISEQRPFKLSIITKDPIEKGNLYKWRWSHYDTTNACKVVIPRQEGGGTTKLINPCCEKCWDYEPCKDCLYIGSDAFTNGKTITTEVGYFPFESRKHYFIVLEQFSISPEYYQFWKITQSQISNSGGIFDNAPAQAQGNLYNIKDSTDQVLGYFSASGLTQKPIYVIRDKREYPVRPLPKEYALVYLAKCVPCQGEIRTKRQPVGWKE